MNRDDTRIGIIDQFLYAVSNSKAYSKLVKQTMGRVLTFAMVVAFVMSIITYVLPTMAFHISVGGLENLFVNKLPQFELKQGVMKIEQPIRIQSDGVSIQIDDTKEKVLLSDLKQETPIEILVGKKNMVVQDLGRVFVIPLERLGGFVLNNQSATEFIPFIYIAEGITLIFMMIGQFCWYLLGAFGFAFFGLSLVYLHRKRNFTLSKLFKIAIYGKVLSTLLGGVNEALHSIIPFEYWYSISMFITFIYISRAIRYDGLEKTEP